MIIIKGVPGMPRSDVLQALQALHTPGEPEVSTGHTGFVVGERLAYRFLRLYLQATSPDPAPPPYATPQVSTQTYAASPVSTQVTVVYPPAEVDGGDGTAPQAGPVPVDGQAEAPEPAEGPAVVDEYQPAPTPQAGTRRGGRRSRRDV